MRTIAVMARKGGSGKSTLAVHLALAAYLRGRTVLLADADPQASAAQALNGRGGAGPTCIKTTARKLFALQMDAVRRGVELMIIDTPAVLEEELGCAIAISDLSLLVVRPTFLDLAATLRTAEVIRRLRKPGLIVMSQAPIARGPLEPAPVRKALDALRLMRLLVVPAVVRSRSVYQTALESGRSVEEAAPEGPAAAEIAELWAFVERMVFSGVRVEPALEAAE